MRRLTRVMNTLFRILLGGRRDGFYAELDPRGKRFIIFNPEWPDPPTKWFADEEEASHQAQRLARKQPGESFYVLKAVREISSSPATVKELPGGDE